MRFGVIVAARMGSSRLPGKALLPLMGKPMILFLLERIKNSNKADKIIFATTRLAEDDELATLVEKAGFPVFRGANEDVVKRFVDCAQEYSLEYVVRVTADCPFVDAETLDFCLELCENFKDFDLASTKKLFPVGIDYEVYKAQTMKKVHELENLDEQDREHLTKYIYDNPDQYNIKRISPKADWICKTVEFTIDEREDYDKFEKVIKEFNNCYFNIKNLIFKVTQ